MEKTKKVRTAGGSSSAHQLAPNTRLSVVYVAGGLTSGGAERELVNQVKALKQRGHQVSVLCFQRGDIFETEIRAAGVEVTHVGGVKNRVARVAAVARALWGLNPHVVHSQHFYTNLYARVAGLLTATASVGSIQSNFEKEAQDRRWLRQASYKWIPWMTANSQRGLKNLRTAGYTRRQSFYLPNAVDIEGMEEERRTRQGAPLPWDAARPSLIAVGRVAQVKRYDRFLRVLRGVRDAGVDAQGVIVGRSGPARPAVEQLMRTLNLGSHVRFLGFRSDVSYLLSKATVYMLCSDREGMPNALQEAMAMGRPIVTARVGAVPELVKHGVDGFVVPAADEEAYIRYIVSLMSESGLRNSVGQAAREKAEVQFSLAALGERLETIYGQVIDA